MAELCADETRDYSPAKSRKRQHADLEPLRSRPAKRPRAGETSQDDPPDDPPTKKTVPAGDPDTWHYPPEFWDRLSTIPLICGALEELNRRTSTRPSFPPRPAGLARDPAPRELARFASHGGPDLTDLRGYPATSSHRPAGAMSSSSPSRAIKSIDPTSVATTSGTTSTKTSKSAYNPGFEQHLTDHGIYATYKSRKPNDLEDIRVALSVPRPSLSPSKFCDSAFDAFQESDDVAKDKADVMIHVIPIITGVRRTDHPSAMTAQFGNLEPLTDGTIAPAKPNFYYGAHPEQLSRPIRDELGRYIIPSTMEDRPMAPNFFLEVKGPDGYASVAQRQARYDGALECAACTVYRATATTSPSTMAALKHSAPSTTEAPSRCTLITLLHRPLPEAGPSTT